MGVKQACCSVWIPVPPAGTVKNSKCLCQAFAEQLPDWSPCIYFTFCKTLTTPHIFFAQTKRLPHQQDENYIIVTVNVIWWFREELIQREQERILTLLLQHAREVHISRVGGELEGDLRVVGDSAGTSIDLRHKAENIQAWQCNSQ